MNPDNSSNTSLDKPHLKVTLSKYDQERQRKALENKRENLYQDQIVMGKKFEGNSFVSKPEIIEFKDFSLNEPHLRTILLTNVSNSFNSFKVLPIEDQYREDFFEVYYIPPGRMSAGIDCKITVKFTPQLNKDIATHLPIQAATGLIRIPLRCSYKRAQVTAERGSVDFGEVLFGEEKELVIELSNAGALETMARVRDSAGRSLRDKTEALSLTTRQQSYVVEGGEAGLGEEGRPGEPGEVSLEGEVDVYDELRFAKLFKVEGYSKYLLKVRYVPQVVREWHTEIEVSFENFMHSPPIRVALRGRCVELPISVERKVYDLEICLLSNTYREQLVFFNRGGTAMKVQVVVPRETKNFLQLNPSFGYIQAKDTLKIWVKLTLAPDFQALCAKFKRTEGDYLIPVQLIASDQKLPVCFDLRVRVTTDKLRLNPKVIDFGLLYQDTGKKVEVAFQNSSDLTQYIYFYPLPKAVRYEPEQIPIAILPAETKLISFVYRGYEVKKEEDFVKAKIITGNISVHQLKLPYKAVVVKPPVRFSALKIDFPTLQIGENSNHLLTIKNYSPKCYVCEIFLPYYKVCGLKISPLVFRLQKGKSIELSVEFHSFFKKLTPFTMADIKEELARDPSTNYELRKRQLQEEQASTRPKDEEEQKGKKKPTAPAPKPPGEKKKTKKEQDEDEAQRLREEEARRLAEAEEEQRRIQLLEQYDHDAELRQLGGKMQEFDVQGFQSQHYSWLVPCFFKPLDEPETARSAIYLEINTVSTTKILVADRTEIGFGEIAVGLKKIEELLITNHGSIPAVLRMDLLPLFGGFNVLNALKAIPPGKTRSVVIQFEPHNQQEFKETLRIYSGQSSISIKLKGTSVKPEVTIAPEDGLLQVGAALPGERVERSFEIRNISNFPVEFSLAPQYTGIRRTDGQDAFLYFPAKGLIDSRQACTVKVVFYPDRVSEKYYNVVKIDVPNQKNEKSIFIKGACYPRQGYISYFKPLEFPRKEELEEAPEHPLDFLKVKDSSRVIGYEMKQMLLTFPKTLEPVAKNSPLLERKITVGSFKLGDPKQEKAVNYDFNLVKDEYSDYFQVDGGKGTLQAGATQVITLRLRQAEPDAFISNILAFQGVGQWIEARGELKMAGGYVPPGQEDAILVQVKLKAYIEKI